MEALFSLALVVLPRVAEGSPDGDFSNSAQNLPIADAVGDEVIHSPEYVRRRDYDYIVVGGRLTGLTAAARLTDNPDTIVLVIESGFWESNRSAEVFDLTPHCGDIFGTAMDHTFPTENQTNDNRSQNVHSGHGLGGSTLVYG